MWTGIGQACAPGVQDAEAAGLERLDHMSETDAASAARRSESLVLILSIVNVLLKDPLSTAR